MTIKQLSKRSGISVSTIRAIETGEKKNMKISTALNLAHALYLSVDVFWFLVTKHA
jgi:transcriptional regulator with XRE-family HTH domain